MNFNISFSSFQETGQTGSKHLLNLVQSPDDTALKKQDDQVTLFPLQFNHILFDTLLEHFWTWIPLLLKIHECGW
jgi:hypothetical protein